VLTLYFILAAVGGYLLGSIPFGLVLTKAAGLGDIRSIGSGNIGATNVMRTGRKDLALATLVLDAGKAGIALFLARTIAGNESPFQIDFGLLAGFAAFIGQCFPVWLGFKGGKGVATYFGLLLVGMPPLGAVAGIGLLSAATNIATPERVGGRDPEQRAALGQRIDHRRRHGDLARGHGCDRHRDRHRHGSRRTVEHPRWLGDRRCGARRRDRHVDRRHGPARSLRQVARRSAWDAHGRPDPRRRDRRHCWPVLRAVWPAFGRSR
jgi:acyl-phosphate glycerol 3-phosphate acyltransferase